MAVKHAVLGLLMERRSYGHELVARLEERLGPGLSVPSGTVYTALRTLEDDGHVVVARRTKRGNQIRVYYEPTADGARLFDEWMAEPISREPMRGELYLKFALADGKRVAALRAAFERLEMACLAEMVAFTSAQNLAEQLTDPVPPDVAVRLLMDSTVLDHLNADRAFIRRVLGVLEWMEETGAVPRSMLLEALPA